MRPSEHVLDMFAVPGATEPVPGGQGRSVRAGDLVLTPGRDPGVRDLLSPQLARLAVALDTRPGRDRRDLRLAVPVPARDGSWVVDGWAATRHESGTRPLTDLAATRAVGAVLHAALAHAVEAPRVLPAEQERRAVAERAAFGDPCLPDRTPDSRREVLLAALLAQRDETPLGPDQLVHPDLPGSVALDAQGAPLVLDVSLLRRPALWAEARWVLHSVVHLGADPAVVEEWGCGPPRQAMVRSAIFALVLAPPAEVSLLERALAPLLTPLRS